jgi:hypothetical protein
MSPDVANVIVDVVYFAVANDGHDGTKVMPDPPHAVTVGSEATHHSDGSVQHFDDYPWVG